MAQYRPYTAAFKITKPDPERGDRFGDYVTVVGDTIAVTSRNDDRFGEEAGAVYLYDRQGEFLSVIGSPNPQQRGWFGEYTAAVGDDRLLIAAGFEDEGAGNVYLFDLDGTLLSTLQAPDRSPGFEFGSRAVLANEISLFIASASDQSLLLNDGAVFKYDHDGELLATITSPRGDTDGCFGRSLAFAGDDMILIGDACDETSTVPFAGAAFLFDLEGNVIQSFDNPKPQSLDGFGSSVAFANGNILIGGVQIDDESSGASTGAAYIFEPDGTLLTRVSDPQPRQGNWFGWNARTIADGQTEQFIVGSIFNGAGKAHVIDSRGEFLQTLPSPSPGRGDQFAIDFAQLDDLLLIGATLDSGGLGAVWVFEPAQPGDYDGNGAFDIDDLQQLCRFISNGIPRRSSLDVTGDDVVNEDDLATFLQLADRLPGDTDFDGVVDFNDFLTLAENFGGLERRTWSDGDFDCNRHVEFADFLQLAANFDGTTAVSTVPEPSTTSWLLLFHLCLLHRTSRGSRDSPRRQSTSHSLTSKALRGGSVRWRS